MAYTEAVPMPGGPVPDAHRASSSNNRAFWRKRLLTGLALCTLAAAIAAGARWYLESAQSVSTDDAYVDAPLAEITPQIDGTIARVVVSDTQHVRQGDLLVQLDPADADLAVQQARAGYEQAMRENFEFAVIIEVDDRAALVAYLTHPSHAALGRHFTQSAAAALAYDYEMVDAADAATLLEDGTGEG